jgi:hypothetical protein
MIGKTDGHYRITARLGAGGMGEVFLGEDTRLDRKAGGHFTRHPQPATKNGAGL